MSAPKSSGGLPSAPYSTPGSATNQINTPSADCSGSTTSWSTIPGLGSAVRPHRSTRLSVVTDGPSLSTSGSDIPEDGVPRSSANALRTLPHVPPKTAGAAPADWQGFLDNRGILSTGATVSMSSISTSAEKSLQPSGGVSQSFSGLDSRYVSTHTPSMKWEQTKEYHDSPISPLSSQNDVALSRTAPLQQADTHVIPTRIPIERHESASSACTEFTDSELSINLSEHYLRQHPEQADLRAPAWTETANPRGLHHALQDPQADWEEAFADALTILSQLNPTKYVMPFGTRVVNIKTDYAGNIQASLRANRYAAIKKVSDRIVAIYKARGDPSEKVIFLFSVNGSKKFCGMAEMSGEWEDTGPIEGWIENPDSAKSHGTIPVTWIYAKDVAYIHFSHIKQAHNGHPVGNMWNGMNFPSETGREVIERYVVTPSTSSMLGYPRNYPENFGITNGRGADRNFDARSNTSQRGRGNFAMRGVARGNRGGARGGFNVSNWRPQPSVSGGPKGGQFEDDSTPTAASTAGRLSSDHKISSSFSTDGKFASPTFTMEDLKNAPVAGNASLLPGEPVSFVMGQDGRLAAVSVASDKKSSLPRSTSSGQESSVFGVDHARSSRFPFANSSNDGGMNADGRRDHHAAPARGPQSPQSVSWLQEAEHAAAARRRRMGHEHSPSAAMLHQAAMVAAQQEAHMRRNHHPAPAQVSWNYHSQQMASMGFQNDGPYRPGFSINHGTGTRQTKVDEYTELSTPTHRPPQHPSRYERDSPNEDGELGDDAITPTYREVPGWQSDVIQGMGHLQLKALFFTLAAEQHILEHQSTKPGLNTEGLEAYRFRMRRVVDLKREVADELYFIGHTIFNHPMDSDDFNPYEHAGRPAQMPGGYAHQQRRISPLRDNYGRRLPSVSETSISPPDVFGMPLRPEPYRPSHVNHVSAYGHQQPFNAHVQGYQQQHSMQSAASTVGGVAASNVASVQQSHWQNAKHPRLS